VLTLAEADAELQRLTLLKKNHLDEQFIARRSVRDLPETVARLSERLAGLTADRATANAHARDPITLGERTWSREDIPAILGGQLEALLRNVRATRRVPLGIYRGLRFGMVLHPQHSPEVYLEGAVILQDTLSRDHHGPRAVLNAIERIANAYGTECAHLRQDLSIAESQLRDYQARLGKPFLHEVYLSELTTMRDQLAVGLSETAQVRGEEAKPTVSEIAERIESLRAEHTIEATTQRIGQRCTSGEEPVTARIRRRTEAKPATATETDSAHPPSEMSPLPETISFPIPKDPLHRRIPSRLGSPTRDHAIESPEVSYRDHIANSRRRDDRQESPS
jgi:hypothetical protein